MLIGVIALGSLLVTTKNEPCDCLEAYNGDNDDDDDDDDDFEKISNILSLMIDANRVMSVCNIVTVCKCN